MNDKTLLSKFQFAILRLHCDKPIPLRYGHHLRGWLIDQFPQEPLVSHHEDMGRSVYLYPRVQSKIIGGDAVIVGIEEGVTFVYEIAAALPKPIPLNREEFTVDRIQHEEKLVSFGIVTSTKQYKFITPWLGLNQNNYQRYSRTPAGRERQYLLSRILIGNILSVAKSLGTVLFEQIETRPFLHMIPIRFKGKSMVGFTGTFRGNLLLPDYIGLGKSVSRGFGTVVRVENDRSI